MQGLEDQLLGDVVRKERPELEAQKDQLVVSISNDKRQLQELEDKVRGCGCIFVAACLCVGVLCWRRPTPSNKRQLQELKDMLSMHTHVFPVPCITCPLWGLVQQARHSWGTGLASCSQGFLVTSHGWVGWVACVLLGTHHHLEFAWWAALHARLECLGHLPNPPPLDTPAADPEAAEGQQRQHPG